VRGLSCSAGRDLKEGGRISCTYLTADRVYIPECKHITVSSNSYFAFISKVNVNTFEVPKF